MPIPFLCPHCANPISAPDGSEGQRGSCTQCGKMIMVPGSEPPAEPTIAADPPNVEGARLGQDAVWTHLVPHGATLALAAIVVLYLVGTSGLSSPFGWPRFWSDTFSQGDRVTLIDPGSNTVSVTDMPDHESANPALRAYRKGMLSGNWDSESISVGTTAVVVRDFPDDKGRKVEILIKDAPYAGLTGKVERRHLRLAK